MRTCYMVAALALLGASGIEAKKNETAQGLNASYPITVGEVIALEIGGTINGMVAAVDKGGLMVLAGYNREDELIEIEVRKMPSARSSKATTIESARTTIGGLIKLLDEFVFPRILNRYGVEIGEEDLSINFLENGKVVLRFVAGQYTLAD